VHIYNRDKLGISPRGGCRPAARRMPARCAAAAGPLRGAWPRRPPRTNESSR